MRYLIHVTFLLGSLNVCWAQLTDSLSQELESRQGAERTPILHDLMINKWLNYPDEAMEHGLEALNISQEFGDSANISKSIRLIAGVHYYKGDYDQSLLYNNEALEIAEKLQDYTLINNGYNNMGLLYLEVGSYQTAMEYLQKSVALKAELGEIYGLSTTLNNIGRIYDLIGNYDEARSYFERALDASAKAKDRVEIYSMNNIGFTYLAEDNIALAMTYFQEALRLGYEYENTFWGTASMRGLAEVFLRKGVPDSAKYYCDLSLKGSQSIDDKKGLCETYQTISKYYFQMRDYPAAITHLDLSQKLARRLKLREMLLENFKLYISIYRDLGNDKMISDYQAKYISLTDSLFQDATTRNLSLVPVKLKEEGDRITMAEQEAEIKRQSDTLKYYIIILLITIPGVLFLIYLLKKNKKAHEEVLSTQKLLITSEKMASLGVMAAGIAHEINNPLNYIKQGAAALQFESQKDGTTQSKTNEKLLEAIDEGVTRAAKIVMSLSHFSRQTTQMDEVCDLKEIIENCLLILQNRLHGKVEVNKQFTKRNLVLGNEGRLHQAMMNILVNAEQAIADKGTMTIKTKTRDQKLFIFIEDDGEGIPQEQLNKIGDPFFTTKSPGKGTGLGLFITYSIIEEHGGKMDVQSTDGKGSIFKVTLPLHEQLSPYKSRATKVSGLP